MNSIKTQEAALRDECERLARAAERRMNDPSLPYAERAAAIEDAKNYWQLSRVHADAVAAAEAARPSKFSGQNKDENRKTAKRKELLTQHRSKVGEGRRAKVIRSAVSAPEFPDLFDSFDEALNFANRHKV